MSPTFPVFYVIATPLSHRGSHTGSELWASLSGMHAKCIIYLKLQRLFLYLPIYRHLLYIRHWTSSPGQKRLSKLFKISWELFSSSENNDSRKQCCIGTVKPYFSKYGWGLAFPGVIGNAELQALLQNYWTGICILPRSQAICLHIQVWRALTEDFREYRDHFQSGT